MIKFLDLHNQYLGIKEEIDASIKKIIDDSAFIGGEEVKSFERKFANYQNARYCTSVGNGTDALEIAIESLELPKKSEVIVPANSFISSAEAVSRNNLKVIFCDVNEDDYTLSINDLEKKITSNTSAVMAVHLYGHPCNMEKILFLAKKYNLKVIEDCAQAHGAEFKNKRVGCIGDIGAFSFYPGKNLGAYGDAGAIVTNDEYLDLKCRMISNHGRIEKYNHKFEGRNSRLDSIQAAILNVKLKYLDEWNDLRASIADQYINKLKNKPFVKVYDKKSWAKHVYHLFVIRVNKRDELIEYLSKKNIQTGIHYPIALPKLEAFKYLNQYDDDGFAWRSSGQILSLPIGTHLNNFDISDICMEISSFYE